MYQYEYPRPAFTADVVVWQVDESASSLSLLLIERAHDPFAGCCALPGGFVDANEDLPIAAARELAEETQLTDLRLVQLQSFGTPHRDPRGWTVTVVYQTILPFGEQQPQPASDARTLAWYSLDTLPDMAFDHALIIATAARHFYVLLQAGICTFLPQSWTKQQEKICLQALEQFLAQQDEA
ncbi:MAG: NUDIX hydrolase [Chitinophagales bacterium]|jgi:8-oxo-dGTP diphosphatase|nr:NUDIX hydrolase [Chitinophagales bacterium]